MRERRAKSQLGTGLAPEPFLNRHVTVFFVWAVWNRIQYLRAV